MAAPLVLRDYQQEVKTELLHGRDSLGMLKQIIVSGTGSGKCHPAGTMVMLAGGGTVPVEQICPGDALMGPDSRPRVVRSTSKGRGRIVKVVPIKGDPWRCNMDHVLTLAGTGRYEGAVVDVSVRDWVAWPQRWRNFHKLYRVPVELPEAAMPIDPYLLGVLMGDGDLTNRRVGVSSVDPEVVAELHRFAEHYGCTIREDIQAGKCPSYFFRTARGKPNPMLDLVRARGYAGMRSGDKAIHVNDLRGSRAQRLELLAGLMDTDGSLSGNCFDYTTKSRLLADNVMWICRSVGLAAYMRRKVVRAGRYWRVSISGETSIVPCRLARKKAAPRKQRKDALRTGFTVEPDGREDYYGFTLSGDGRYLLSDFTVTHNTVMATDLIQDHQREGHRALFLADRENLVTQASKALWRFGVRHGMAQGPRNWGRSELVLVSSPQTVSRRRMHLGEFRIIVVDECHITFEYIREAMQTLEGIFWVGLSATPFKPGLADLWDRAVNARPTNQLVQTGDLSGLKIYYGKAKVQPGDRNSRGEYEAQSSSDNVLKIVGDILGDWERLTFEHFGGPVKTIAFANSVADAEALAARFREAGHDFRAVHYLMGTKAKQDLIDAHDAGEILGLVSPEALQRGYDVADILCVIDAHPWRRSVSAVLQQAGRGMRPAPGKDYCLVLDAAQNFIRHKRDIFDFFAVGVTDLVSAGKKDQALGEDDPDREGAVCPDCGELLVQEPPCPSCGWEPKPVVREESGGSPAGVKIVDGEMVPLDPGDEREWVAQVGRREYALPRPVVGWEIIVYVVRGWGVAEDNVHRVCHGYFRNLYGHFIKRRVQPHHAGMKPDPEAHGDLVAAMNHRNRLRTERWRRNRGRRVAGCE